MLSCATSPVLSIFAPPKNHASPNEFPGLRTAVIVWVPSGQNIFEPASNAFHFDKNINLTIENGRPLRRRTFSTPSRLKTVKIWPFLLFLQNRFCSKSFRCAFCNFQIYIFNKFAWNLQRNFWFAYAQILIFKVKNQILSRPRLSWSARSKRYPCNFLQLSYWITVMTLIRGQASF